MNTPKDDNAATAMQKAVNYMLLWKVALAKLFIQCAITAITYYLGAMANTHYGDMDMDSKVKLFMGMGVGILTLWWAFLGKAEKSLAIGNYIPPDDSPDGGTQTWTRKQVDVVTTTAPAPPAAAQPPAAPEQHPPILPK